MAPFNEAAFWSKVHRHRPDACWTWLGWKDDKGYGRVIFDGRNRGVHRVSYELLVGPIPQGLHIDHLCRNPACVNPAHLEPVTLVENARRGYGYSARNARKTHCKYGHEFTEANTYRRGGGGRRCRRCASHDSMAYSKRRSQTRTHCPNGHPLNGNNQHVDATGRRKCKQCGWTKKANEAS
jgi:hypothetical protein